VIAVLHAGAPQHFGCTVNGVLSPRLQAHPSNAYDERSLRLFAQGLRDAGYRDRAASVYYSLLQVKFVGV